MLWMAIVPHMFREAERREILRRIGRFGCFGRFGGFGRLPPTLDAVVPEYLDAVPADPYDGKPFRYVPEKAVVYSVSKDLQDSGGSEKSTTGEAYETETQRLVNAEDAVFYIHGPPKPKEAAESTDSSETPKPADSP